MPTDVVEGALQKWHDAHLAFESRDFQKSRELCIDALSAAEPNLADEVRINIREALGVSCHKLGHYEEAAQINRRTLELLEQWTKSFGASHKQAVDVRLNLAQDLLALHGQNPLLPDRLEEAVRLQRENLEILKGKAKSKSIVKRQEDLVIDLVRLGKLYSDSRQTTLLREAVSVGQDVVRSREASQGVTSLRTVEARHNLASALFHLKDFDAAKRLFLQNQAICDGWCASKRERQNYFLESTERHLAACLEATKDLGLSFSTRLTVDIGSKPEEKEEQELQDAPSLREREHEREREDPSPLLVVEDAGKPDERGAHVASSGLSTAEANGVVDSMSAEPASEAEAERVPLDFIGDKVSTPDFEDKEVPPTDITNQAEELSASFHLKPPAEQTTPDGVQETALQKLSKDNITASLPSERSRSEIERSGDAHKGQADHAKSQTPPGDPISEAAPVEFIFPGSYPSPDDDSESILGAVDTQLIRPLVQEIDDSAQTADTPVEEDRGHLFEALAAGNDADRWFLNLYKITHSLLNYDDEAKIPPRTRIRIAILDSGLELPSTRSRIRPDIRPYRHRLKQFKSFTTPPSPDWTDSSPILHGTNIASLLLRVAPHSDLYIANVIDPTSHRPTQPAVHAALSWALDQDVDIVSMSLGFETWHHGISTEIDRARRSHTLIFAAASNDADFAPSGGRFPAWLPTVFCVNACTGTGVRSAFNPRYTDDKVNFMFLGEAITLSPHRDQPPITLTGTSYATPIAAGLAALVLDLARVQQIDIKHPKVERHLKSYEGMTAVFKEMSGSPTHGDDYYHVRPWELLHGRGPALMKGDGVDASPSWYALMNVAACLRSKFGDLKGPL